MIREVRHDASLGQVYLAGDKQPLFSASVEVEQLRGRPRVDHRRSEIFSLEYERDKAILTAKKQTLIRGARLLLEKEKLDGEEIRALLAEAPAVEKAD